ncbi:HEAT repeat domain-containing protein [Nocardia thailandica]|uniref:HEAT repeat domain-containing protein n=1 Tax=Nocardia thailandica TaxID=257275 RepID=UPI001574F3BA|nr:HEAT repeat domain-containing protein [Nocardia thailandica]
MVVVNTTHYDGPDARLVAALAAGTSSARLRAALAAGTSGDARLVPAVIARCAVEPDFFVRDMLTWALCRMPAAEVVPGVTAELGAAGAQARSQALHTLSKIGDRRVYPAVVALLEDDHDEVARSAWRAAVALVPPGEEAALAARLARSLGRGDLDLRRSLSRALVGLGDAAVAAVTAAAASRDPRVRAHAGAAERLRLDPESGFAIDYAERVAATGVQG